VPEARGPDPPGHVPKRSPTEEPARQEEQRPHRGPPPKETPEAPLAADGWEYFGHARPHARRRRHHRRSRRSLRHKAAVGLLVLAMLFGAGISAALVVAGSPDLVLTCSLASSRPHVAGRESLLDATDGSRLGTVPATRHREPVSLRRISPWLPEATVEVEDRRFWERGALDYGAIARAAVADLKAGGVVQGGSTLAQQYVRDSYLVGQGATLHRKLQEACLAVKLEQKWSKHEVLQAYLNEVFYGERAYGAQAAAWTYFSRSARHLTLPQAALLAGLPQAPSVYDPFTDPAAARTRRNEVLAAMRSAGSISASRYRAATGSSLELHPGKRYTRVRAAPFFDYALRGLLRRYRGRAQQGGLHVRTTLDARLQSLADTALAGWLHTPTDPAGVLVAIAPRNGALRAMAVATPGRTPLRFNLASQSHRQAGSAFKTFTLTAALEQGIPLSSVWHGPPSLTIPSRRCLNANGVWVVHNFADETAGTMTLEQAIAHSVNTIFAQVAMRVGPAHVVDVAHRMGIRSHLEPVCSITLGPEGVSPLEMTAAFATLADRGVRHSVHALEKVTLPSGRTVARLHARGRRALSRGVAHSVTQALTGVIRGGTGVAADPGRPAAGKTGTAESFKDAWFCGYVPQLAACAWIGNPYAETPMRGVDGFAQVVGGSVPARIWHDFMVPALSGEAVEPLP
jgi:penicillin-binding protein 1A